MIYILNILFLLFTPAKKYELELQLRKGEVYYQNTTSSSQVKQSFMGMKLIIDKETSSSLKFKVLSVTDDSYKFEVSPEWLELSMSSGLTSKSFSSKTTDEDADQVSKVLRELTKNSFTVDMTHKGDVTEISGVDELFEGILNQFPEMSAMQKQEVRDQVSEVFSKAEISGDIDLWSSLFPNRKVTVNDSWTSTIKFQSGMEATKEATFELVEINDDYVEIEMTSGIFTTDKTTKLQVAGSDARYQISGNGVATFRLNRGSMWVRDGTISEEMSGKIKVDPNDQIPDGMNVPIEVEIETNIKDR